MTTRQQYLTRKRKPKVAHLWLGRDTACRMYSTGGMRTKRYVVSNDRRDLPICTMCLAVTQRGAPADPDSDDIVLAALNRIKHQETAP